MSVVPGKEAVIESWRSAITDADGEHLRIRGVAVTSLMKQASFCDVVGLLLNGRLPDEDTAALPRTWRADVVKLQVPGLDAERHLVSLARVNGGPKAKPPAR